MFKPYAVLWTLGLLIAAAWFMQPGADVRAAEDDVAVEMDVAAEQPLTVVTYSDGRTGFFDQATRTIYIYDRALRRCDTIRQIQTLGESLERVRN